MSTVSRSAPDGGTLASGSWDETVRPVGCGHVVGTKPPSRGIRTGSVSVAFSPDGGTLASGSKDGTVRLWDAVTGRHKATLTGHTFYASSVAFSPNGRTLASGSRDATIRLWDGVTGAHKLTLTGHTGNVRSVAFSPDGGTLASGGHDKTVRLWDAVTGAAQSRPSRGIRTGVLGVSRSAPMAAR